MSPKLCAERCYVPRYGFQQRRSFSVRRTIRRSAPLASFRFAESQTQMKLSALRIPALLILISFSLVSCDSNENRQEGVCYCEFFRGDDQEYDLTTLPRDEQVTECNRHNSNAAGFGGRCELE